MTTTTQRNITVPDSRGLAPGASADNNDDEGAFRAAPTVARAVSNLGLLENLPGHWVGRGFNLIARPDHEHGRVFLLELNPTRETLDFVTIGGDIPNRGSLQNDVNLHGVHYLQQVSDRRSDTGIHIEPGLWIRVPPTDDPAVADDTYVRQATIPHGDSLLAQSVFAKGDAIRPRIDPVDSTPFTGAVHGINEPAEDLLTNAFYLKPYLTRELPRTMSHDLVAADVIKNPALLLLDDIADQEITNTVVISVSSDPVGGIVNIPFVVENANATRIDAIFWIETVRHPYFGEYLQLQYVQRVILDFNGIHWPHISVATLRKQ